MGAAEAMFFAHPFWPWIALGGVFLIGELMTGSGWLLWPAGAAGTTAVVTIVWPFGWPLQIVLFVVVAIVATYVGRRFLRPADGAKGDINDQSRRLVGKEGEATGEIYIEAGDELTKQKIAMLDEGSQPPQISARCRP